MFLSPKKIYTITWVWGSYLGKYGPAGKTPETLKGCPQ